MSKFWTNLLNVQAFRLTGADSRGGLKCLVNSLKIIVYKRHAIYYYHFMTKKINAECPTCKAPLPVALDKQSIVRVAICKKCGDEFQYSAWVMFVRNEKTFSKIEIERVATGHHVRPLKEE